MTDRELILALRKIKVPDRHACFGCGYEHNCGIHGCVIIKEAINRIEAAQQSNNSLTLKQLREMDGRLVVLPCKVGDTVWTNIAIVGDRYKSADRPYPVEVVFIGMGKDDRFFHVQYESGTVFPFDYEKFGKTVFLTREEAEDALKKREESV